MRISPSSTTTLDSDTAGSTPHQSQDSDEDAAPPAQSRLWRSLWAKLGLLAVVFVSVPIILYNQFRAADAEQQALLLATARDKGLIIARAMQPLLARADTVPFVRLTDEIARYGSDQIRIKLLFQPLTDGGQPGGFYFVAAAPAVSLLGLEHERRQLLELGVLDQLGVSCAWELPIALRLRQNAGADELLTSITPVRTAGGCWALLISHTGRELTGSRLDRPYWQSNEVRLAAIIYVAMALLVLALFFDLWRGIYRFGRLARAIRRGQSKQTTFSDRNSIPELDEVARDFDRMVETLNLSAESIRRAAEDNAHALKNPLGIIRQALELLQRRADPADARVQHGLGAIAASVDKLDGLIASARRLDQAMADLLQPPDESVDLTALVRRMVAGFERSSAAEQRHVVCTAEGRLKVSGAEDLLETVLENLIDNALSFTPPGGAVQVALRRVGHRAVLTIDDEGPGVPADKLERIFDRYYSSRANQPGNSLGPHFGIGLWIVRRNVEALSGSVRVTNRPEGGFRAQIELPLRP